MNRGLRNFETSVNWSAHSYLDLTGPYPITPRGNRFILTIADHYSRWTEAFPVGNQEAQTVARILVDQWIARFGCPLQLLTDIGPCFEAQLLQDLCRMLNIHKLATSGYKPSTNRLLERFHRTLNTLFAKFVSESHRDWDLKLPTVLAAPRPRCPHTSTWNICYFSKYVISTPGDLYATGFDLERLLPTEQIASLSWVFLSWVRLRKRTTDSIYCCAGKRLYRDTGEGSRLPIRLVGQEQGISGWAVGVLLTPEVREECCLQCGHQLTRPWQVPPILALQRDCIHRLRGNDCTRGLLGNDCTRGLPGNDCTAL